MAFKKSKQSISKEAMFSKIMPSLKDDEEIIEETPKYPAQSAAKPNYPQKNNAEQAVRPALHENNVPVSEGNNMKQEINPEIIQKVTEELINKNHESRKPKFTKEELEKTLSEIFGGLPKSDSQKETVTEKSHTPKQPDNSTKNDTSTFDSILKEVSEQNKKYNEIHIPTFDSEEISGEVDKQTESQSVYPENTMSVQEPEKEVYEEPARKTVAPQKIAKPVQVTQISEPEEAETTEPIIKKATVTAKVVRPVPVNTISSAQSEIAEISSEKNEEPKNDISKRRTGKGRVRKSKTNDEKPEQKDETEVINLNEELVIARFDEIFKKFNCCHCNSCRFNIMAGILNEIPANYVTIKKGERDKAVADADDAKIRQTIIQAVLKNMIKPNH